MKLSTYLTRTGISVPKFARKAGMSDEGVRRILRGERLPRRETAEKIAKATGGKVTHEDLLHEAAA